MPIFDREREQTVCKIRLHAWVRCYNRLISFLLPFDFKSYQAYNVCTFYSQTATHSCVKIRDNDFIKLQFQCRSEISTLTSNFTKAKEEAGAYFYRESEPFAKFVYVSSWLKRFSIPFTVSNMKRMSNWSGAYFQSLPAKGWGYDPETEIWVSCVTRIR